MLPWITQYKRGCVYRACTHCRDSHAKCSNIKPCIRCINKGIGDSCIIIPRKPRYVKKIEKLQREQQFIPLTTNMTNIQEIAIDLFGIDFNIEKDLFNEINVIAKEKISE